MQFPMIEKDGIELGIEERQEKAILKSLQKIIGKSGIGNFTKVVKELTERRIIIFPSQTVNNHKPDPHQVCIQRKVAIERLVATGKVLKLIARFNPESKQIYQRLAYITESKIDSGKIWISLSQDRYIVILKAKINEGEMISVSCAELLEMNDRNGFDYSLSETECPCGGMASPILTDVTYNFDNKEIVVESVPVLLCSKCGEIYGDTLIDIRTEQQAYKAMNENKSKTEF